MTPVTRSRYDVSYSIGPGALTPAVKMLLIANTAVFVLQWIVSGLVDYLGLTPALVIERLFLWQVVTYLFLHGGIIHLLFNMLALWMFGVDLERRWGQQAFLRYYFVCGVGAALCSVVAGLLFSVFGFGDRLYITPTVGASGAIYGLLLAYGLLFPERTIFLFIFPVPARIYVILVGVLILYQSAGDPMGGTAHFAHLGGMLFGYAYLTWGRGGPMAELKYRYTKWRMARLRKKFGVHPGGRGGGWNERIH
jgi:membrane associated rhomboid family serine protease